MVMVFGAEVKVKRFAFIIAFSVQQQQIMHTNYYTNERTQKTAFFSSTPIMFQSKVILCDAVSNGPKHNKLTMM